MVSTLDLQTLASCSTFRLFRPFDPQPHLPLFIFLPGMDGTGILQQQQAKSLKEVYDVRCLSIPTNDLSTWNQMTDAVLTLIRTEIRTSLPRPVYLCGESFGGCLALKVMVKAPQLFDRLILINPASSFKHYAWMSWGAHLTRWIPELLYPASCIGLLPFLAALERMKLDDRRLLLQVMNAVTQASSVWRLSLLQTFDIPEREYRRITQPTLLIASQGDRLLPSVIEAQRLTKHIPQAQTYTLHNSGHACLLESDLSLYDVLRTCHFLN